MALDNTSHIHLSTDHFVIDNFRKVAIHHIIDLTFVHSLTIKSVMAFSFGFSGDDIEEDPNDVLPQTSEQSAPGSDLPPPIAARTHDLGELVGTQHYNTKMIIKILHCASLPED